MEHKVFSSLPVDVEKLVDAEELAAVRRFLEEQPQGVWTTAHRIESLLGWKRQQTAEKVRRAVKELQLLGVPVVESHAGFTIAYRPEMVERCLEKERVRRRGLDRTIRALEEIKEHMEGEA